MKPIGQYVVAVPGIVCLSMMAAACGARHGGAAEPRPPDVVNAQRPTAPAAESVPEAKPATEPPATVPPNEAIPRREADIGGCGLIAEPGEPITTVALAERIDPSHAPSPSNESERLLFRQLYETLVRVDCHGRVRPGLAVSWRLDADGRTWILTLREGARFSDGTAVTAAAVRAGWALGSDGSSLRLQVRRLVSSVVAIDDRTLAIALADPRPGDPLALAHTDLAVARPAVDSSWPQGTRGVAAPERDTPVALAESVLAIKRDKFPAIRVLVAPRDPRDLLDAGIDLLLTRDPATLAYAATRPEFQSVPLEWQRTQVLLSPGRTAASPSLSEETRQRLAEDAIRGESRGAVGPFWWESMPDCGIAFAAVQMQSPLTPRLVYDGADAAARDLAERLVAVARAPGSAGSAIASALLPDRPRRDYQRVAALTGEPWQQARRRGADAGYIVSLDRRPLDPCRELAVVLDGAPWLDRETIVPLTDTRLHAIVRRGKAGAATEWDGGLILTLAPDGEP